MSTKRIRAALDDASPKHPNLSRWILPATAEAYEQMLQQMHDAYSHRPPGNNPNLGLPSENRMRAALRAIGITPLKKGCT